MNSIKVQRIIGYETVYGIVDKWSEDEKKNVARILKINTKELNNFIKKIILFRIIEDQFSNNPIVLSDEEEKKILNPNTYNISKKQSKKRKIGGSRSHKRKNKRSNKFRKN